ncbi:MAG: hypothetical protein BGN96_08995 [Bacteroidales bacterium 45-6]|nr:MAG: hypothetical protein BGN96_08995 [Bacteroidales bacterium 45-6]
MKHNLYIICLLAICYSLISCDKSEIDHETEYNNSYSKWLAFRKSSQNSYSYRASDFSEISVARTRINVTNGIVTRREFECIRYYPSNDTVKWVEKNMDEINTHNDREATKAITLDQIYHDAKTEWLVKRDGMNIIFTTDSQGIISTCGYQEDNCPDCSFTGVHIDEVRTLYLMED